MRITVEAPAAAAVVLALGLGAGSAGAARPVLALGACEIEHPLLHTVIAAECGVLTVVENPQAPTGRHIGLAVARVPAISRRKQPDPLFILAGGPGQAASDFYTTVAGAFARIQRERDIVLVDQRGIVVGRYPGEASTAQLATLIDQKLLTSSVAASASP